MAKIHEEVVVIKLSKLIKEKDDNSNNIIATNDICDALQAVAEELAGTGVVVEMDHLVERA